MHETLGVIAIWNSLVDLVLLSWVVFIFANRLFWSVKACTTMKFKKSAKAIHCSMLATLGYTLYLTYLYSRTFYKGFNDSSCTLLGQISTFLYFIANFGIWMFYWQRHSATVVSTNYHRRIQRIGLVLFSACLLGATVLIFSYWQLVNNPDGTCLIAETHRLGFDNLQDDMVIIICIMGMDLICSTFISLTFIIPIKKFLRRYSSTESNSPLDTNRTSAIETQRTLRRLALCAFIATFSTVICIAGAAVINKT